MPIYNMENCLGIIWVVEKSDLKKKTLSPQLIGNFPVRCIASVDSFAKIIKMNRGSVPKVVIFNQTGLQHLVPKIERIVEEYCPDIVRVYVTDAYGKVPRLGDSTQDHGQTLVFTYENDLEEIELNREISKLLLLRPTKSPEVDSLIKYKDIAFNYDNHEFQIVPGGEKENLPLKEARLLKYFLENPGKCLSRDEIKVSVWSQVKVAPRTIDSHISRLRKRISFGEVNIESIYGGGYVLK